MRDPDQPYRPSTAASELPEPVQAAPFGPGRAWPIPERRLLSIEELAVMTARLIAACGGAVLLVLCVIWVPVNAIEMYVELYSGLSDTPIVLQIGLWAVDIAGGMGLLFVARDRLMGDERGDFESIANRVAARYPAVLTTEALAFIAVIIGLLLLIVPGILVALYLAFTLPAAALRDRKLFAALSYSKDLVSGRAGDVFGRLLAMSVPLIAVAAITIVVMVLLESGELSVPAPIDGKIAIAAVSLVWFTLIDVAYLPVSLAALILFFNLERVQAFEQDFDAATGRSPAGESPSSFRKD